MLLPPKYTFRSFTPQPSLQGRMGRIESHGFYVELARDCISAIGFMFRRFGGGARRRPHDADKESHPPKRHFLIPPYATQVKHLFPDIPATNPLGCIQQICWRVGRLGFTRTVFFHQQRPHFMLLKPCLPVDSMGTELIGDSSEMPPPGGVLEYAHFYPGVLKGPLKRLGSTERRKRSKLRGAFQRIC